MTPESVTWERYPTDDSLTMYLCMAHYLMGACDSDPDKGHRHWVLPPKDGKACIICDAVKMRTALAAIAGLAASVHEDADAVYGSAWSEVLATARHAMGDTP